MNDNISLLTTGIKESHEAQSLNFSAALQVLKSLVEIQLKVKDMTNQSHRVRHKKTVAKTERWRHLVAIL